MSRIPFPGCATTLAAALDEIEEYLDDRTDGAPDNPSGREAGRLLMQLQYVRELEAAREAELDAQRDAIAARGLTPADMLASRVDAAYDRARDEESLS